MCIIYFQKEQKNILYVCVSTHTHIERERAERMGKQV